MLYSFSLRPFGGEGLKNHSLICLGAVVPPLRTLGMTIDRVFDISVELAERVMLIDQMSQWSGRIFGGKLSQCKCACVNKPIYLWLMCLGNKTSAFIWWYLCERTIGVQSHVIVQFFKLIDQNEN